MNRRIPIDFARRCLENPAAQSLGQAQHVNGAVHRCLRRLHRIALIMDGRGRAGQIVNRAYFDVEREGNVVTEELETFVFPEVGDVALRAGCEIVDAKHLVSISHEPVAKMRSQEPCSPSDEDRPSHVLPPLLT
jgi:hypothetical protein